MSEQDPPEIRRSVPGASEGPGPGSDAADYRAAVAPVVPDGPVRWRVRPVLPVLKAVGGVLFLAAGLLSATDRVALVLGIGCALLLGALAVRDVIAGTRLAADPGGVTVVTGFAGHRRLPWSEIEGLRLDRRTRLGVSSALVEVDAGDQLYLFTRNDLGADCRDVLAVLEVLRSRAQPGDESG